MRVDVKCACGCMQAQRRDSSALPKKNPLFKFPLGRIKIAAHLSSIPAQTLNLVVEPGDGIAARGLSVRRTQR